MNDELSAVIDSNNLLIYLRLHRNLSDEMAGSVFRHLQSFFYFCEFARKNESMRGAKFEVNVIVFTVYVFRHMAQGVLVRISETGR